MIERQRPTVARGDCAQRSLATLPKNGLITVLVIGCITMSSVGQADNPARQATEHLPRHAQIETAPKQASTQSTTVPPIRYRATVKERKAFDRSNFTQGLEFHGDRLLVSSGLYGKSTIRSYHWPELVLEREQALPQEWFAEGLTIFDERLYVLTWRARRLLVFNYPALTPLGSSDFPTEGWGLAHADNRLYWSDGSDKIYSINAREGGQVDHISVTLSGRPVQRLNELEWVKGELWANVWQTDTIVRIDPTSGVVVGIIDLRGLLPTSERKSDTDVLNGIAYDALNDEVWVTGKRWPWLYKIGLERQ